ncbi:MAG TPA: hypothetical protein VGR28_06030 [Candidatus Thermoplasmatota archaeon]|jgi:hypothetical protein|nr:hypothetical protein [Candidatus Thermoplasmatota archaeon]
MGERRSWSELVFIPVFLIIVSSLVAYAFSTVDDAKKEIRYTVGEPFTFDLNRSIVVDATRTDAIVTYHLRLWNSGGAVLENVTLDAVFSNTSPNFTLFSWEHHASWHPDSDLAGISHVRYSNLTSRITFAILNPRAVDDIQFAASHPAQLALGTVFPGLSLVKVEDGSDGEVPLPWAVAVVAGVSLLSVLLVGKLEKMFPVPRLRARFERVRRER